MYAPKPKQVQLTHFCNVKMQYYPTQLDESSYPPMPRTPPFVHVLNQPSIALSSLSTHKVHVDRQPIGAGHENVGAWERGVGQS